MHTRLPLFPLRTVLFPGAQLPLHIFEERYRQLVRGLLEVPVGAPRRFGVVAIRLGSEVGTGAAVHDIGCTAELRDVTPYPDGRFDIVTTGGVRFRVHRLDTSEPLLGADVELLPEPTGAVGTLVARAAGLFARYLAAFAAARGVALPQPSLPADPVALSYLIGASTVLDPADEQALLAAPDAATRLQLACRLLRRETGLLQKLRAVPSSGLAHAHAPN